MYSKIQNGGSNGGQIFKKLFDFYEIWYLRGFRVLNAIPSLEFQN